jgi:hypothetical protein
MTPRRPACLALLAVLCAAPAHAMEPCSPDTHLANPGRPSAEWSRLATWVAVGVVVDRTEKKVPYPNCGLKDRSACSQWDRSELTVKVERYEKGTGPKELRLVAAYCAPDPPARAGGRYRFFGHDPSQYVMYEQARGAPARRTTGR